MKQRLLKGCIEVEDVVDFEPSPLVMELPEFVTRSPSREGGDAVALQVEKRPPRESTHPTSGCFNQQRTVLILHEQRLAGAHTLNDERIYREGAGVEIDFAGAAGRIERGAPSNVPPSLNHFCSDATEIVASTFRNVRSLFAVEPINEALLPVFPNVPALTKVPAMETMALLP